MMLMNNRTVETEEGFLIDPFGAAPDWSSRIAGLGGSHPGGEPGYAFRTLPILPGSPAMEFIVRVTGLRAHAGTLNIDLTATTVREGSNAVTVRTVAVPLIELADGRPVSIGFATERDTLYAVSGYVHDDIAVSADQLAIELRATAEAPPRAAAQPAPVETPAPYRLTSLDPPDFGDPVSQAMSMEQCHHPEYHRWLTAFPSGAPPARQWSRAFILQAFDRYGTLRRGRRVLAIGPADQALDAVFDARGCATVHAGALRDSRPCDLAWSLDLTAGRERFEHAVWYSVENLAPGGMAVHVAGFTPTGPARADAIDRPVIERAALNLISHGHAVAQLKFRTPDRRGGAAAGPIPFALILCRS